MSEQKESSVLFSLKELMNLEEDRIKNEEADRAAAASAAEKARADAELAARNAEESRIRAEEERRRLEEQRAREEAARLEAIRTAEIEKARVEAEQRARMEAMAAQQQHERSLAVIQQDQGKKKLRNMLIAGGVAVAVLGGGGGYLAYQNSVKQQQELQAAAEQSRLAQEEKKKLEASMAEQQRKVDSLISQLSSATDESTRLSCRSSSTRSARRPRPSRRAAAGRRAAAAAAAAPRLLATAPQAIRSAAASDLDYMLDMTTAARGRLVFPLDFATIAEARAAATRLAAGVGVLKVGLELFVSEGPAAAALGRELGLEVFLDLKLHDIPETVDRAVASAAALGVRYLTVHAAGGAEMLRRAVARAAQAPSPLTILAVTVLTSLDAEDLRAQGVEGAPSEQVLRLARVAWGAGVRGFVASSAEVRALREALGPEALLVIRGSGRPGRRRAIRSGSPRRRARSPTARICWSSAGRSATRRIRGRCGRCGGGDRASLAGPRRAGGHRARERRS